MMNTASETITEMTVVAEDGTVRTIELTPSTTVHFLDLAVLVKGSQGDGSERVTRLVAKDGVLVASQEDRATWTCTARNEDATARLTFEI